MKKAVIFIVLVLVVGSLFALAQQQEQDGVGQGPEEQSASEQSVEQSCGFWCKMWGSVGNLFSGERQEAVVGKAVVYSTRGYELVRPTTAAKYYIFDGENWKILDSRGKDIPFSDSKAQKTFNGYMVGFENSPPETTIRYDDIRRKIYDTDLNGVLTNTEIIAANLLGGSTTNLREGPVVPESSSVEEPSAAAPTPSVPADPSVGEKKAADSTPPPPSPTAPSPTPSSEQPISSIKGFPQAQVYKMSGEERFYYTEINGAVYKVDAKTGQLSNILGDLTIEQFKSAVSGGTLTSVTNFQPTEPLPIATQPIIVKTPTSKDVNVELDPQFNIATITAGSSDLTAAGAIDQTIPDAIKFSNAYEVTIGGNPAKYDPKKGAYYAPDQFDNLGELKKGAIPINIDAKTKIVVRSIIPKLPSPPSSSRTENELLEAAAPSPDDAVARAAGFGPGVPGIEWKKENNRYYLEKDNEIFWINPDGTRTLEVYQEGGSGVPVYTIQYDKAGNAQLVNFEGLKQLGGDVGDHRALVDRLHREGFLIGTQYQDDTGFWENSMEDVHDQIKSNLDLYQEVRISGSDQTLPYGGSALRWNELNEDQRERFANEDEYKQFVETYRKAAQAQTALAKTTPLPPAAAGIAPAGQPVQPITVAAGTNLPNGVIVEVDTSSPSSVTIHYDFKTNKDLTAGEAVLGSVPDVKDNSNQYTFKIGNLDARFDPVSKEFYTTDKFDEGGNLKPEFTKEKDRIKMTTDTKITVTRKAPSAAPPTAAAKKAPPPKPPKTTHQKLHDREITHQQAFEELDGKAKAKEKEAKTAQEAADKAATGAPPEQDLKEAKDNMQELKKEAEKKGATDETKNKAKKAEEEYNKLKKAAAPAQKAKKTAETAKKEADEARRAAEAMRWQGNFLEVLTNTQEYQTIKAYGSTVGDIATGLQRLGSYQALSNAIWGPETSRNWLVNADHEFFQWFANFPSFMATRSGLASEDCEIDDARISKSDGQSSQFVQTASGTFQFVGAIQAERSPASSPILCRRTDDPEAEEEFICSKKQVCLEGFCYADKDQDEEPDAAAPLKGYFYKITWGVTAPQDAKFTPYIDENNKSVRFNLQLNGARSIWLYSRPGAAGASVLQLSNGQSDREVLTHFSSEEPPFSQACLRYDPRYRIKDRDGTEVVDQCVDIILSTKGKVQFDSSSQTPSYTSGSEGVDQNADW